MLRQQPPRMPLQNHVDKKLLRRVPAVRIPFILPLTRRVLVLPFAGHRRHRLFPLRAGRLGDHAHAAGDPRVGYFRGYRGAVAAHPGPLDVAEDEGEILGVRGDGRRLLRQAQLGGEDEGCAGRFYVVRICNWVFLLL